MFFTNDIFFKKKYGGHSASKFFHKRKNLDYILELSVQDTPQK
jgi:hypothetical protein